MKKIISIIMAATMLFFCLPSGAAQEALTTVEAQSEDLFVKITVKTTKETDKLTLKVLHAENETVLYASQKKTPDKIEEEKYVYTFSFYATDGTVSGNYVATAGGIGGTVSSGLFRVITHEDKRNFYNELNEKTAEEMQEYFAKHDLFLPQPYADYEKIDPALMALMNQEIADMDLAVSEDYSNLSRVEKAFGEVYAKSVLLANVVQEKDVQKWDGYTRELIQNFGFFGAYYKNLDPIVVYHYFQTEKTDTVDMKKIQKAFDASVLLSVTRELNATILRDAIEDYEKQGTIPMDLTDYNRLGKNAKLKVCEKLKEEEPKTMEEWIKNLKDIAKEISEEDDSERPAASGGGGGGGGSTAGKGGNVAVSGDRTEETQPPQENSYIAFSDISHVEWAKESVVYLAEAGVLNGKEPGKFYPDDYVTREEFVKIISEAFGYTQDGLYADFSDVPPERWSYKYVASVQNIGVISGMGDGTFGATQDITRQDMAVILSKVLALADIRAEGGTSFKDEGDIADYAKDAVGMLSALGIVSGMGDGTFLPLANVTRAQAAKAVYETLMVVIS